MKLISWNVNGIRSCLNKGFMDFVSRENPDILALQETKASQDVFALDAPGYHIYSSHADKKGYSGTAVLSKEKPVSVSYGLADDIFNHEGRVITLEFNSFFFVCVYVPNSQRELARIDFRLSFDKALQDHLSELAKRKSVIMTGDLNVAHKPIDLRNPKSNEGNAGYSIQERESFQRLLDNGFIDTFRYFYPDKEGAYSWWSYMFKAREKDIGWRIDYFIASNDMKPILKDAGIYKEIYGSDHAPIYLDIDKIS